MQQYTIGIDEVGRGSWAGPIVVAAVAMPPKFKILNLKFKIKEIKLKDSKKLSAEQRLIWWQWIKNQPCIKYAFARVYPKTIDRINITRAANLAATRAFKKLNLQGRILLDGGLKIDDRLGIAYKTIVKGDEKYDAIKMASIAAKVHRDGIMGRNHYLYRRYGFYRHKGYGTKEHREAVKKLGPCPIHRLTYLKKVINVK